MSPNPARRRRLWFLALVPLLVTTAIGIRPTPTHAQSLIDVKFPFQQPFQIFCGGRQIVVTQGVEHLLGTMTVTPSGAFHYQLHLNVENTRGVSLVTGNIYAANGTEYIDVTLNASSAGFDDSFNTHLISQGSESNFLVHQNAHFTIDANGNVTGMPANYWDTCVG